MWGISDKYDPFTSLIYQIYVFRALQFDGDSPWHWRDLPTSKMISLRSNTECCSTHWLDTFLEQVVIGTLVQSTWKSYIIEVPGKVLDLDRQRIEERVDLRYRYRRQ
jgi:hypothetical protein